MKPGRASRTAELVCMGRALAHARSSAARFEDPTALALLPADARAKVEEVRAGRGRGIDRVYLEKQSKIMVARTVEVDDAVRAAGNTQVVILGAGLDGRAWRMPELRDAIVFEADHPDSQRDKRARAQALTQTAREVRFVAVDFVRDDLDAKLAAAGHDSAQPTTWIWEGVVMYLTAPEVEATLAIVAGRSAAGSRLVIVYHSPAAILRIVGLVTRWLGEPLRSTFTPGQIGSLLAKHDFHVVRDRDVGTIGAELGPDVAEGARVARHLRVVTAAR